jgi:hypothetical protein
MFFNFISVNSDMQDLQYYTDRTMALNQGLWVPTGMFPPPKGELSNVVE